MKHSLLCHYENSSWGKKLLHVIVKPKKVTCEATEPRLESSTS
jgi:hypothetical protein